MKTKNMKKNWILRAALLVLILTLVTWSLVSGTFAKYTETVTGTDSTRVANFAYTVEDSKGSEMSTVSVASIALFDCVDNGVAVIDGVKLIAPGTTGNFGLKVSNTSEVLVEAAFNLTLTDTSENSIPVYFTYEGNNYADFYTEENATTAISGVTLSGTIEDLAAVLSAEASEIAVNDYIDFAITWTWAFEANGTVQNNASDTALGNKGTDTLTLEVAATISQLNG